MGKRIARNYILIIISVFGLFGMIACSAGSYTPKEANAVSVKEDEKPLTVVGFSQVGAESDWRSANTESIKAAFTEEKGYELIYEDAQQKQTNQITAIRSFIQQDVDYIVLAPVTETGWETVLGEARDAGIPVILVDRMVKVTDEDLYTCWIGSDFELEGRKVCNWLASYLKTIDFPAEDVHIVDIQGTLGSSAQLGRTKGFEESAELFGWDVVSLVEGEFTRSKGKEAMFNILREYNDVNVVYCENDNEALGVIDALEANGITPGFDIAAGEVMVLSFDGVNEEARNNLRNGKIACIGQCNPDTGSRVEMTVKKMMEGNTPDKYQYVGEKLFSAYEGIKEIMVGGRQFEISL